MNDQPTKTTHKKKPKKRGSHYKSSEMGSNPEEVTANNHYPLSSTSSSTDCASAAVKDSDCRKMSDRPKREKPGKSCLNDNFSQNMSSKQTEAENKRPQAANDVLLDVIEGQVDRTKAELKAERQALFEAQKVAKETRSKIRVVSIGEETSSAREVAVTDGRSKAELKSERRALQEAQRTAKAGKKTESQAAVSNQNINHERTRSSEETAVILPASITKETNCQITKTDRTSAVDKHDDDCHTMPDRPRTESCSQNMSSKQAEAKDELLETAKEVSSGVVDGRVEKTKAELKAERRALFEAQRSAESTVKDVTVLAGRSKSELKAERRALQESQRAAKVGKKNESQTAVVSKRDVDHEVKRGSEETAATSAASVTKQTDLQAMKAKTTKQKQTLFSHLSQYERNVSVLESINDGIHPAIIKLGLQYADGVICGSTARCVGLIDALQKVIHDFKTPKDKEISHALAEIVLDASLRHAAEIIGAALRLCLSPKNLSQEGKLNDTLRTAQMATIQFYYVVENQVCCCSFLDKCRRISVGMRNVSKKLREEIVNMDKSLCEAEVKTELISFLQTFYKDNIEKAHEAIVNLAKDKIALNDVILTYGCSFVVKQVLAAAHKTVDFRVIVVDSRPKLEGRSMFDFLVKEGIKCSYVLINAVSYAMQEATKVMFGAHALLANGYVMSRVGSSQVALVAKAFNKPVLVCCETYKFCDLVQTDSFVVNELGDKNDIVETNGRTDPLKGSSDLPHLNVLNLYYDVTPPDLITVVINDVCLVPCTSVPVLLRVKPTKRLN